MKAKLMYVLAALYCGACSKATNDQSNLSGPDSWSPNPISVSFSSTASTSVQQNFQKKRMIEGDGQSGVSTVTAPLQGFYFGQTEIVAYNYRPGQSLQTGCGTAASGCKNWSYWMILPGGYPDTNDRVIKPGERFDVAKMQSKDAYVQLPSLDFAKGVGSFNVDAFEIWIASPGFINNNVFYGPAFGNSDVAHNKFCASTVVAGDPCADILHNYPEWAGIQKYYITPNFSGLPGSLTAGTSFSVLFVRNDWFPTPVSIQFDPYQWGKIVASSSPLSDTQKNIIQSLAIEGTHRRYPMNYLIVPFSADAVPSIPLKVVQVPTTGCDSSGKGGPTSVPVASNGTAANDANISGGIKVSAAKLSEGPAASSSKTSCTMPAVSAPQVTVDVNISLSSDIFDSTTVWNGAASVINLHSDANGIPLGLKSTVLVGPR